jgi:hypothetical protein
MAPREMEDADGRTLAVLAEGRRGGRADLPGMHLKALLAELPGRDLSPQHALRYE